MPFAVSDRTEVSSAQQREGLPGNGSSLAGFLANGATVYISSRKADALEATAGRLAEEYGGECIPIPADLSKVEEAERLADALKEGGQR